MANTFVSIRRDANAGPYANAILTYRNTLIQLLDQGDTLIEMMRNNFDDSDPNNIDWTELEALFGVPTGKGKTVWDFINGSQGAMRGTMQNDQCLQIRARLG